MTSKPTVLVDLTAPSTSMEYAEILTPGGVVRVNVGLVDTQTGRPVVVVEVEPQHPARPNRCYSKAHAAPTGDWESDVREHVGLRTDVTLTRTRP